MRRVWEKVFVGTAVLLSALVLVDRFAFYVPSQDVGGRVFRLHYALSIDKDSFFDDFRSRLRKHGGGYIPSPIANFLNERLELSHDAREVSAIARFYSCQAGGREGVVVEALSDHARRKVAQAVLRDWKTYPQWGREHGFVLLEGLRQNVYLGKANVVGPHMIYPIPTRQLAPVGALFDQWNRHYASVPFTERPNPLAGTPYRIEAP